MVRRGGTVGINRRKGRMSDAGIVKVGIVLEQDSDLSTFLWSSVFKDVDESVQEDEHKFRGQTDYAKLLTSV